MHWSQPYQGAKKRGSHLLYAPALDNHRMPLAQLAAKTPKLLILDEMTNNLDLETRDHVIEVFKNYPGAMIVISHDEDFLRAIDMHYSYMIKDGFFDEVI